MPVVNRSRASGVGKGEADSRSAMKAQGGDGSMLRIFSGNRWPVARLSTRGALLALLCVVGLVAAGCGSSSEGTTASAGSTSTPAAGGASTSGGSGGAAVSAAKVDIADFAYSPPTITVKKGGSITWTNSDDADHTATQSPGGSGFDTGTLSKGDSKTIKFDQSGTFQYVCLFHAFMKGTVKVVG